MLRGLPWLALALVPALAACSLIYRSDLDDARRRGAASESSSDAGPEGGTPPSVVSEAGPDAVVPPRGPLGCSAYPTAKFCDDFDTKPNVGDDWDKLSLSADQAKGGFDAVSPPRSFLASLADAPSCTYARLEKGIGSGSGVTHATVSALVRPQATWSGSAGIFYVALNGCGIILSLSTESTTDSIINAQYLDRNGMQQNDVRLLDGFPVPDEWTDVTFDANAQPDGHVKLDVVYVHASGARDDKQVDLPQCRLGGTIFVGLGFHCSEDTHDVRYDDVRVSWE